MTSNLLRNAILLGLLTAIGPFAIDMYLPAMPVIAADLGAPAERVTLSLIAFFIPFGICQLVFGTLSDFVGRKPPLYFGLSLFFIASIGCALAGDVETLIAWRVLQGIGAAAPSVIPRAIVRDMHSGLEEVRLMSMLMLVFSVSPLLAPLVGSLIVEAAGWRVVFWSVTAPALLGAVLLAMFVKETRANAAADRPSLAGLLRTYRTLLTDPNYLGFVLLGAFGVASFFVYLGNSSFVLMGHYNFSPIAYSFAFSINAAAFFAAAQFNGWLGKRFGLRRMILPAVGAHAGAMTLLLLLSLAGVESLAVLGAVLFIGYGFLGLFLPLTGVLALERYGAVAGAAASLMGTLHLLIGAGVMAASSVFQDGTVGPMIAAIAFCSLTGLALAVFTVAQAKHSAPAQ